MPGEITITGFHPYKEIRNRGWTRANFGPLLEKLIGCLPEEFQGSVVPHVKVFGYRNIKFCVDVEGPHTKEIQQCWQEWFSGAFVQDPTDDMSDEITTNIEIEDIKVYCQRSPDREARPIVWQAESRCKL